MHTVSNFLKHSLSAILVLTLLLTALASCGGTDAPVSGGTDAAGTAAPETVTEAETEAGDIPDGLPEKDYGGYQFRIMAADSYGIEFIYTAEQDGSVVNDSMYTANVNVQERFNIGMEHIPMSTWTATNEVSKPILAGDDAFDLAVAHDCNLAKLTLDDLFLNLYGIPHLDFTKPWWPEYTVESMTLNGRMYLISNYMGYYGFWSTRTIFFNKDLVTSYSLENPYDLVRSGDWTLDRIAEMTKDIYLDLNGNNASDVEDQFGFACTVPYCWLENFGIESYGKSPDGKTVSLTINNEKTVDLLDRMLAWLGGGNPGTYYSSTHSDRQGKDSSCTMFANGNVVFTYGAIGHILTGLHDSTINYGLLPNPKFDAKQEAYIAACTEIPGVLPITTADADRTGVIIEAMSAEGYRNLIPAYYEMALKSKYTYDTDSVEMLDIMFANRVLSFSYMYHGPTNFQQIINNMLSSGGDFASYYAKNESGELDNIAKINAYYGK